MKKAHLFLIVTTFFWGLTFHLSKYALLFISPLQLASFRFLIGSFFLLIYCYYFIYNKNFNKFINEIYKILKLTHKDTLILATIGIFGYNYFFYKGIQITNPAKGAIILASNPLITVILLRIFKGEKLSLWKLSGILIALAGVILVILDFKEIHKMNYNFNYGDFWILTASISWSIYGIKGRDFFLKYKEKYINEINITFLNVLIGSLMLLILWFVEFIHLSTSEFISRTDVNLILLFMGIFSTGFAYIWWYKGIKEIGTSNTSIFLNLVPVIVIIIDFILESYISYTKILGGLCVITGVTIINKIK